MKKLFKKTWLKGGIIGLFVCLVLSLIYIFMYFPIIEKLYGDAIPSWALIAPMITGHAFPLFSIFFVPYGLFCRFTELICTSWSISNGPGGVPWTLETGEKGYCLNQVMTPTSFCEGVSDAIGFWGLVVLLFALYFLVGALIARFIEKKKRLHR